MCIYNKGIKTSESKHVKTRKRDLIMKDNFNDLSKADLLNEMRVLKEKQQNDFIDKLNNDIDWLIEKAMKKEYQATEHERTIFNNIRQKLENMNKWF